MKRLIAILFFLSSLLPVVAQDIKRNPENLTLTLAMIANSGYPAQYIFVINGVVAYKSVEDLKNYLKSLPKGSTLTWSPGCCRFGNEPLLSSKEDMKKFIEFCDSIGIKLILIPSG